MASDIDNLKAASATLADDIASAFDVDKIKAVTGTFLDAIPGSAAAIQGFGDAVASIANSSALTSITEKMQGVADKVGGPIQAALSGFQGALTLGLTAVQGLVGPVAQFVAALNPQLMEAFSQAVTGLMATIGVAFEPLVQAMIPLVQQISGALLPVAEALVPVVAQLADIFAAVLMPVVRIVAQVMLALTPIIQILAVFLQLVVTGLQPLFTIIEILAVAFRTLMESVGKLLLGPLGKIMEGFASIIKMVVESLIIFAVQLAKAFGFDDFVKNLIDDLRPKTGATPGAKNFGITGLEQISKDIALAAAQAAPGAQGKEDPNAAIVARLEQIRDGQVGILGDIATVVKGIFERVKAIADKLGAAAQKVWDVVSAPVKVPYRFFRRRLLGMED